MLRSILFFNKTKAVDLIGQVGKLVDVVMQGTVLSLEKLGFQDWCLGFVSDS